MGVARSVAKHHLLLGALPPVGGTRQRGAAPVSARHSRGLWWVKRDLRLADNDALGLALDECDEVLALYVAEPSLWRAPESSALHHHAWGEATDALGSALRERGGHLCLRVGEVVDVLEELYERDGFDALYAHEEIGGEVTYARDRAGACAGVADRGVPFRRAAAERRHPRASRTEAERQPIIRERLVETPLRPAPSRCPPGAPCGRRPAVAVLARR